MSHVQHGKSEAVFRHKALRERLEISGKQLSQRKESECNIAFVTLTLAGACGSVMDSISFLLFPWSSQYLDYGV